MDEENRGTVRKLTLEHWFINHQLEAIRERHFHLPGSFDVDVTLAVGELDPLRPTSVMTAMTVKALGLLLEERPDLNRIYARTVFGARLICPDYVAVNVPILIDVGDRKVQSAIIIQSPHQKSVDEIRSEMRTAVKVGLVDKPIARFVSSHSNSWWNRAALRILHFAAYQFPQLYVKRKAGGVSLSSMIYEGKSSTPMTTVSFGPTAFTVALTSAWQEGGRWNLRLGVAFDHFVGGGELAIYFAKRLAMILGAQDAAMFERLTGKPLHSSLKSPAVKEKMVTL
jgi:hypothetical protein